MSIVSPEDIVGKALNRAINGADGSLFRILRIPDALHGIMEFAGVQFVPKNGAGALALGSWSVDKLSDPTNWIMTMPTKLSGHRVEIPINDPIDKDNPEEHWRAILAAAADFQTLVNTDQYDPRSVFDRT